MTRWIHVCEDILALLAQPFTSPALLSLLLQVLPHLSSVGSLGAMQPWRHQRAPSPPGPLRRAYRWGSARS